MKLVFRGHDERYVVEQSLMNLFPGELPVYEPITPGDDSWAVISLEETGDLCRVAVELPGRQDHRADLSGAPLRRRFPAGGPPPPRRRRLLLPGGPGRHRHNAPLGHADRRPARQAGDLGPGGREVPGRGPGVFGGALFRHPLPGRPGPGDRRHRGQGRPAAGEAGHRRVRGHSLLPTRCAYCSFVSQSVEKSFALVPPYVDALVAEIPAGGEMVRRAGLRVRAFYMGGGTPTTLTAEQMDRVLTALRPPSTVPPVRRSLWRRPAGHHHGGEAGSAPLPRRRPGSP